MARIIASVYMGRYPLGGMMSWSLQWLVGFARLGHDVYAVEKADYPKAWFVPGERRMSDDATVGFEVVERLLRRFGLPSRYLALEVRGRSHGEPRKKLEELFRAADVLIDLGNHGAWLEEADAVGLPSVRVDGEPGMTQIRMEEARRALLPQRSFTHYFSNGANIGSSRTGAPSAGKRWGHVFNPVVTELFSRDEAPPSGPFTTVMNWQSHQPIEFQGRVWGQKDVEFAKFLHLPCLSRAKLEVAVAGAAPIAELRAHGWKVKQGHSVTRTLGAFNRYIRSSLGEFSVCKEIFVGLRTGWFSDRSAVYLAAGRPVILQDTGFAEYLPAGRGLFAVKTPEEAAEAIAIVRSDPGRHSRWAREIAQDHLDAGVVLPRLLREIGVAA
jgi:hypothetical protein